LRRADFPATAMIEAFHDCERLWVHSLDSRVIVAI
jgi:hypothetical protein